MSQTPRHQCLIYQGEPSRQLASLTLLIRRKLESNCRCLYLNSPEMIANIRTYLTSSGVNVSEEIAKKRLILSSSQAHLIDGEFDPERMLALLQEAYDSALNDGFSGLWASGDMAWELGPARDFRKLVEYERALEMFLQTHPKMSGICQYHEDVLPDDAVQKGLELHPGIYVNETLSRLNPQYLQP